jgi:heterodisulfide reductase subunit D
MTTQKIEIPVMSDLFARGEKPEYLFWVGCAGAFDDRYKKVVRAFAKILTHLKVSYAVLGKEETCTGDPARRAGNEMLYQMQAMQVIAILNNYGVKKIITICPHCFNIFKNEYPDLGGNYEVVNYLQFLEKQADNGNLSLDKNALNDLSVTYHDPCAGPTIYTTSQEYCSGNSLAGLLRWRGIEALPCAAEPVVRRCSRRQKKASGRFLLKGPKMP